jgi:hypothetical protein
MSGASIVRISLAVCRWLLANGVLVAATEQLPSLRGFGLNSTRSPFYSGVDLTGHCLYTVVGGYLCWQLLGLVGLAWPV